MGRDSERPTEAGMLIGEAAERTGLTQRTLRYYEEIGLLPPSARREGGFRVYTEADVQRIEHILQLKRLLGFSLLQIKEIVEAEEERKGHRHAYHREPDPAAQRAHVERALDIARRELARLDAHLADVQSFRAKVERRIARYAAELASLDRSGDETGGLQPAHSLTVAAPGLQSRERQTPAGR